MYMKISRTAGFVKYAIAQGFLERDIGSSAGTMRGPACGIKVGKGGRPPFLPQTRYTVTMSVDIGDYQFSTGYRPVTGT